MATARVENDALTGIRGVAALLVAIYHYFLPLMPPHSLASRLFGRGYLYVDLFFLLSGYVMALNYGRRFVGHIGAQDCLRFLWKRFARVYPLYICVFATLTLGYWCVYGDLRDHRGWVIVDMPRPWVEFPVNLLLVQAWGAVPGVVGQAWSVSTEVAAYLAFPWLAQVIFRPGRFRVAWTMLAFATMPIAAASLAAGDGAHHSGTLDIYAGIPALLRCFGGFVLGIGLYRLSCEALGRLAESDRFCVAILLSFAILLLVEAPDLTLYPCLVLLILCLARNRGKMARGLAWRPVHTLGLFSYAFYLLHVYFIRPRDELASMLAAQTPTWLAWGLASTMTLGATVGAAACAYQLIEVPARQMLANFGTKMPVRLPQPV